MLATTANRTMQALPDVIAFVERSCAHAAVSARATFDVKLAVEEVYANAAMHGGATHVDVAVDVRAPEIVVTIRDDGRPFDPSSAPDADTTSPWQQRRPGGLGWHLVRRVVDRIQYERRGSENVVTLTKIDAEVNGGSQRA